MSDHDILSATNLTKTFRDGERSITVLSDVSFALKRGESCAIMGPSGSGKTTLLGLCAGLDEPTAGRVTLFGRDVTSMDEEARARLRAERIGFIFQTFRLLPALTALENVMLPLEIRGQDADLSREKARARIEDVGLSDRETHYPSQLSGGEQQRIAIARAFVHTPDLLFADEPSGNLDEANAALVSDLLFDLNHRAGTTLVVVTHNLELAKRCQRILTLHHGHAQPAA